MYYRNLNDTINKDDFALPRFDVSLDQLSEAEGFSGLI